MATYRDALPQLSGDLFITDGGIETTLIFHEGLDLPHFASFVLLGNDKGCKVLQKYFRTYASLAKQQGVGLIMESPTWRASPDWAAKLGCTPEALAKMNRAAIELLVDIRDAFETGHHPIVISGNIGPRHDGYFPDYFMSVSEAEAYHRIQIDTLSETPTDMILAFTMTYAEEAIGITRAACAADLPVAISFTVETDGRLPNGQALKDAIDQVDQATAQALVYYMINCAHPAHFEGILDPNEPWMQRLQGIRANASTQSHAELDEAEVLDMGDPIAFGQQLGTLRQTFGNFNVLGGCCGTDPRHIEAICKTCA